MNGPTELISSFGSDMFKYCLVHLIKTILVKKYNVPLNRLLSYDDVQLNVESYGLKDFVTMMKTLKKGTLSDKVMKNYETLIKLFIHVWHECERHSDDI